MAPTPRSTKLTQLLQLERPIIQAPMARAHGSALTVAVNDVGIGGSHPAETLPLETWDKLYGVNVSGVFLSCQVEARVMRPRRRGSIINVASMSGSIFNRGLLQAHYNSSKGGRHPHVEEPRHGTVVRPRPARQRDQPGLYADPR